MNRFQIEPPQSCQPITSRADFNEIAQSALVIQQTINSAPFEGKITTVCFLYCFDSDQVTAYIIYFNGGCITAEASL